MNLKELFTYDYECIRYEQSGKMYDGYIKVVNEDFIEARVCELDKYDCKDGAWFDAIIYAQSFKGLKMQWWFEGQGCDNSAIGISGSWEDISNIVEEAA
jgi:hypothetical protein